MAVSKERVLYYIFPFSAIILLLTLHPEFLYQLHRMVGKLGIAQSGLAQILLETTSDRHIDDIPSTATQRSLSAITVPCQFARRMSEPQPLPDRGCQSGLIQRVKVQAVHLLDPNVLGTPDFSNGPGRTVALDLCHPPPFVQQLQAAAQMLR